MASRHEITIMILVMSCLRKHVVFTMSAADRQLQPRVQPPTSTLHPPPPPTSHPLRISMSRPWSVDENVNRSRSPHSTPCFSHRASSRCKNRSCDHRRPLRSLAKIELALYVYVPPASMPPHPAKYFHLGFISNHVFERRLGHPAEYWRRHQALVRCGHRRDVPRRDILRPRVKDWPSSNQEESHDGVRVHHAGCVRYVLYGTIAVDDRHPQRSVRARGDAALDIRRLPRGPLLGRDVTSSLSRLSGGYSANIGDGIIIWRVYAFWSQGRERLILIIPLAFLLGSLAMSMSITYCATRLGADIVLGTFTHPAFCRNIQTASYSMTLATTGVATLLISYKAWQYRRIHFEAFGKLSRPTRVQRIMVMLIESGVLYMLFFLVQVVSSIASVNASIDRHPAISFGFTVYQFMTSLIVGMYPTVIVILMHSKHAFLRPGTTHGATSYTGDTRWHRDLDSSTRGVGSGFVSKGVGSGSSSHGTGSATVAGACRTYLNSTHARPTRPTAVVDLYEMAHRGSAGSLSAGSAGGHGKPRMSDVEGDGEKIVGGG